MFDSIKRLIFGGNSSSNNRSGGGLFGNRSYRTLIYSLVPFEQAKNMIEENRVMLIDVRTPSEYEAMHITCAINIPVEELFQKMTPPEAGKGIMVYCSSGTRSKNAIQILNNLGYNNIYIWEYAALATFPYKNMLEYNEG